MAATPPPAATRGLAIGARPPLPGAIGRRPRRPRLAYSVRLRAAIVCGAAFVAAYLWSQHRRLLRLDPTATARDYQAAPLARIDRQIALLGGVRYWYLLPLYVPVLFQVAHTWQAHQRAAAVLVLVVVTALYAGLAYVNERLAVNYLKQERARVAVRRARDAHD